MRYRLTLVVGCLLAVALARPFAAHADAKEVRCQVATSALRIRSGPDEDQIGTAYGGTWLTATSKSADGAWVQVAWSGRQAWALAQYLTCSSDLNDLSVAGDATASSKNEPSSGKDAAAASPVADQKTAAPAANAAPTVDPMVTTMLDAINQVRAQYGLQPYALDMRAEDAAQWMADDMVARHYFSHYTPDGKGWAQRMRERGLPCPGWCGENIIQGQTADQIAYSINWWMHSTIHRANLLSQRYTGIGVGVAQPPWTGARYFVLNFFGE